MPASSRVVHRLIPLLALASPILVSVAACGDDAEDAGAPATIVARFSTGDSATPPFLDVPYPSDAYLVGGKMTAPGLEDTFKANAPLLQAQLAQVNGWSRIAPALFLVDDLAQPPNEDTGEPHGAAIDRASLPPHENACKADGSSVFLVDLDAPSPEAARVPCRALLLDERDLDSGRTYLAVGPARGVVLDEGHRYAAVLTSRVKDASGQHLGASADFTKTVRDRQGPLAPLYAAAYDAVTAVLAPALASDHAEVVSLAPYTTQDVTGELYALRDALEAAPAPKLAWDAATVAPMGAVKFARASSGAVPAGFTASLDAWLGVVDPKAKLPDGTDDPDETLPVRAHDAIASVGTAVFSAVNYLRVRPGKYDDVEHATFARDASGKIVPAPEKPTSKIWVTVAVPTAPMPPAGYPAVIVQHGLGGSRAYLLSLANTLCKMGWVAVAIDSVTFGARAADPKYQVDTSTDYAGAPGATYRGPDGLADAVDGGRNGAFDFFGSLKNILAIRDQLRQAALDTAQLVKVLRAKPDLSPLDTGSGAPAIDPDRIAYVGDSLGGIEGALAAAIEPRVKAWTLNVAGGGILVEIGAHGPGINANLAIAGSINFGFRGGQFTEAHPVVVLGQTLAEGGDPIAYADRLVTAPAPLVGAPTPPRNVFQTEVVYDELVANEGGEALARAAGFGLATPNVGTNSGVYDLTAPDRPYPGGGVALPSLTPDARGFHDTPRTGVTALVAQVSPGQHGADLVRSTGARTFQIPFATEEGGLHALRGEPVLVPCPYRELQAAMTHFFDEAFAGRVPSISGLPAPARDADGDGAPDATDPKVLDATP